jgi:rhamnulokinase
MAVPADDAAMMRLIFDSLAAKYAEVLEKLRGIAPFEIKALHVIGGGAQNALLNQMTAMACGVPVVAGPSEATALGNVMVQARAAGLVGSLSEMRRYILRSIETKRYEPRN